MELFFRIAVGTVFLQMQGEPYILAATNCVGRISDEIFMEAIIAAIVKKLSDAFALLIQRVDGELASGTECILGERRIIEQLCDGVVGNIVSDFLNKIRNARL